MFDPVKHFLPIQSVDESLHQLAQHLTELTKLTNEDIIERYFQERNFFETFHRWLPILSPDSFRREASQYREEGRAPPADFTVVLLAMMQIILPSLKLSTRLSCAKRDVMYTSVKSAFAQAQASIGTSLRLVQGALLIALHDYMCVRPESAYIFMMTCVGMARVMGIQIVSVSVTKGERSLNDPRVEKVESKNVAWAMAMLERYK